MKEHLNKTTMTGDRFIEAFLDGLAGEGLKHGNKARRAEYRRGYPHASEAAIQMLLDAGLTERIDHRSYQAQGIDREPVPMMPQKVLLTLKKTRPAQ